jgi:hypothetical protein
MTYRFALMLLSAAVFFCLAGCAQDGFDSDSIKISGDMTTAIGIGHGVRGSQSATVGVDF